MTLSFPIVVKIKMEHPVQNNKHLQTSLFHIDVKIKTKHPGQTKHSQTFYTTNPVPKVCILFLIKMFKATTIPKCEK